jgi:hypothetical protein
MKLAGKTIGFCEGGEGRGGILECGEKIGKKLKELEEDCGVKRIWRGGRKGKWQLLGG